MTLKDLFLLRKAISPHDSTPFVEFSNGEVSAVAHNAGARTNKKNFLQDAFLAQQSTDSYKAQQKCFKSLSDNIAEDTVSTKARKSGTEKGAELRIDVLALMHQDPLDSTPQSISPSSESCIGTPLTPATSTTSSNFPLPPHIPNPAVPDSQSVCTGEIHFLAGDITYLKTSQLFRLAVQDLPSFDVDTKNVSFCCEGLDLVQPKYYEIFNEPLASLDLASSEFKKIAHAIERKFAFASLDSPDVEIALDESSGELYLQSVPFRNSSQSRFTMIDIDAMFEDDDDVDMPPVHPIVELPATAPIHTCMTLEHSKASTSLGLRQALPESTVEVLETVNANYREMWLERLEELTGTLEKDETKYYEAIYDEGLQDQAVAQFESDNFTISKEIIDLLQPFIVTFLQVWCEGPGGNSNKSYGRWIPGVDEPEVSDITVKLVEWQQFVNSSKQTQSVQLRPGTVVLEEASSPSNWYLQALGGDGQYREHRRVKVEESDNDENGSGEEPVHHINFNGNNVYQRSSTPPEVSFWAASTTYDKVLVQRPFLSPKDKNFSLKPLPAVHVTRVLAAQAFKWVDPTIYTGDDICALWEKRGSAMRNAATSDVNVVYQQVGTWNLDEVTEDFTPRTAPSDLAYEYGANGNYRCLQLPYHVYDDSDEHCMVELNVGKQPKNHFHTYATQIRSPTSLLQYELGAELAKKAALLDGRMEKRTSLRRPIKCMEIVEEEASIIEEDVGNEDKASILTATRDIQDWPDYVRGACTPAESEKKFEEEASDDDEEAAFGMMENASDVSTDVEEGVDFDREPIDFMESTGNVEGLQSTMGGDPMVHAEDPDLDRGPQYLLEDGRYLSPSKMIPSRMYQIRTPSQSLSKADDHGSWELDEAGNFISPSKSESSIGCLKENEDDVEEILDLLEDQAISLSGKLATSPLESALNVVHYPLVQLIGKSWDSDDVFGLSAVHNNVNVNAEDGPQVSRSRNRDSGSSADPDVDAEIKETYAAIAEKRSQRLRSRVLREAWDSENSSGVKKEKESSDGDNGIDNDHTTLSERLDRVSHSTRDTLPRSPKSTTSRCFELEVDLTTRSSECKETKREECSNPQEHPKAAFLAQFKGKDPAKKSNKSFLSIIEEGEIIIPFTNLGDLALGPEYPNLVVADCAPPDYNDPLIDDLLGVPDLDPECVSASTNEVITEDIGPAVLFPLEDGGSFEDTASDTDTRTGEYNAFTSRPRNTTSILSPIQAGDTEDESSPIKARRSIAKGKGRLYPLVTETFRDFLTARPSSTQPDPINEESEVIPLTNVPQQEKQQPSIRAEHHISTQDHPLPPKATLSIQTDCEIPTKHHEITQTSSEESSPSTSEPHSLTSSQQLTAQTSPSSLHSEELQFPENHNSPRKLIIDETSPTYQPLVQCWKHISVAVNTLPIRKTNTEISACTTYPKQRTKTGETQRIPSPKSEIPPAAEKLSKAVRSPNLSRVSGSGPSYAQVAIAAAQAAIEVAWWVVWKCLW